MKWMTVYISMEKALKLLDFKLVVSFHSIIFITCIETSISMLKMSMDLDATIMQDISPKISPRW